MKRPWKFLLPLAAVIAVCVPIAIQFCFSGRPAWRATFNITRMSIVDGKPMIGGQCPASFDYNTFTDETHHEVIEQIYADACRRLENLRGSVKIQTFTWVDLLGYPGISTVLQLPSGYFRVDAHVGNDSDVVSVWASHGDFLADFNSREFKPKLRELSGWALPESFLKTEWRNR